MQGKGGVTGLRLVTRQLVRPRATELVHLRRRRLARQVTTRALAVEPEQSVQRQSGGHLVRVRVGVRVKG